MRKSSLFAWVFAVLFCGLSAVALSQEPAKTIIGAGIKGAEFSRYCPESDSTWSPCADYIRAYYGSKSDLIIGTLDAIDSQKDRARDEATYHRYWDRVLSGTLIMLAFLTTLSAAVSRTYRDETKYPLELRNFLGLMPIVMSALVTLGATFNAYYKFDQARSQNTLVAEELARLQTTIGFELMQQVSLTDKDAVEIEPKLIGDWRGQLDAIMATYRSGTKKPKSK